MNILITGGAGYIGSHTALSLMDKGNSVSIIDSLITGKKKLIPKKAKYFNFDISNKEEMKSLLNNNTFDIVIHFAGLIKVDESVRYPEKYYFNNFEKSKIFFNCCFENKIKKIIFSSTAGVYGNNNSTNIKESENLLPLNPYAESKLKIEKFLIENSKKEGISYKILRYFNVAGADKEKRSGLISDGSTNLIKILCEVATNKKKEIIINGNDYETKDGTAVRDFIHVSDVAEMHSIVAEYLNKNTKSGIYNCGYGRGFSVKEVIKEMENIIERKLNVKIGPRREKDIPFSVSNVDKFKNHFNWKPKFNNLNCILSSALNWEKSLK